MKFGGEKPTEMKSGMIKLILSERMTYSKEPVSFLMPSYKPFATVKYDFTVILSWLNIPVVSPTS